MIYGKYLETIFTSILTYHILELRKKVT